MAQRPRPPTFCLSDDTSRAVHDELLARGCVEYNSAVHSSCDLQWTTKRCLASPSVSQPHSPTPSLSSSPRSSRGQAAPRRVNHFGRTGAITQKDSLARTMRRMRTVYGRVYDFVPQSFILPREADAWHQARLKDGQRSLRPPSQTEERKEQLSFVESAPPLWIVKPALSSQGRGITLVHGLSATAFARPSIAQRYLYEPHLLHGHKYDLRLYVLLTSLRPLTVYLSTAGLCRFSSSPYHPSSPSLFAHLTNSSLASRRSASAVPLPPGLRGSCKWTLREYLEEVGHAEQLWTELEALVLLTVVALVGEGEVSEGSFELLGFDVMRDASGKLWLIEVNKSPSLTVKGAADEDVKPTMLRDLFALLGIGAGCDGTRRTAVGEPSRNASVSGGQRGVAKDVGCWHAIWPTTAKEAELNEKVNRATMRAERHPAAVVGRYVCSVVDVGKERLAVARRAAKCAAT